jgi:hypothetical protein
MNCSHVSCSSLRALELGQLAAAVSACVEGEAVVAGFGDIPDILVGCLVLVHCLTTMFSEVPQGYVLTSV